LVIDVQLKRAVGLHGAYGKDYSFIIIRPEIDHSTERLVAAGHSSADLGHAEIIRRRRQGPTEQKQSRNQHKRPPAPSPHGVNVNGHALSWNLGD
jgi:hypothetical protein